VSPFCNLINEFVWYSNKLTLIMQLPQHSFPPPSAMEPDEVIRVQKEADDILARLQQTNLPLALVKESWRSIKNIQADVAGVIQRDRQEVSFLHGSHA